MMLGSKSRDFFEEVFQFYFLRHSAERHTFLEENSDRLSIKVMVRYPY
jgi:hypothetical protein